MDDAGLARFRGFVVRVGPTLGPMHVAVCFVLATIMTLATLALSVMMAVQGADNEAGLFLSLFMAFSFLGWTMTYAAWLLRGAHRLLQAGT